MTNKKFSGLGVAMVTPFNDRMEIDFPAIEKLTNHLIEGGVNYLVVMGTTGENPTLSATEQKEVTQAVIKTNNGRLPVVLGVGGNNTATVVNTLKTMDYTGIDAVLSVSPYYNKPNQAGIILHYTEVANAAQKPVILYNVPGRTGSNMTAATTLALAKHPNIMAVKEASGNFDQVMEIIGNKPEDFMVISGDDGYTFPHLTLGMDGVISVIGNGYPKEFSGMIQDIFNGNYDNARATHYSLLPMIDAIFEDGSPAGIKVALKQLGICHPFVRLPLAGVNEDVSQKIVHLHHTINSK